LEEVVVITWAHDPKVQEQSYALLAQEMGLNARSSNPSPSSSPSLLAA